MPARMAPSRMKLASTVRRRKPRTRNVPISRVREPTLAYIVFIAANTAPMDIAVASRLPSILIGRAVVVWAA